VVNFCLKQNKSQLEDNGVKIYIEKKRGYFYKYYKIFQVIKREKPDIIISNFGYVNPAILAGRILRVKSNIAWFHTAHGHTRPSFIKILNKRIYLNLASMVMANSHRLEKEIHSIYKVPKRRTKCLAFWSNISDYQPCPKTSDFFNKEKIFKIGCPARLLEDKNHQLVIKAVSQLQNECSKPVSLYIAGSGDHLHSLQLLVNNLGLQEYVIFLGKLSIEEMAAYYKSMNVIVLPSYHEAFGLVFIEAIALGTPVIVSSKFGALDFIDKKDFSLDLFTFDPYSLQDLVNHLKIYLSNEGLSSEFFISMYRNTFNKKIIYNALKEILTN